MARPLVRTDLLDAPDLRGVEFAQAWTDRVETWLAEVFAQATGTRQAPGGLALVAVGGQGRRELAPQSDLDLLLLFEGGQAPTEVAEALWYPVWDEGLKLGHAVRSVRDTLSLASSDLDTATALLTARHICGDEDLTVELAERARTNWRRRGRGWIEQLAKSVEQRHRDAGEIAFELEPDLKQARGGLRDVHALSWAVAAGAQLDGHRTVGLRAEHDVLFEARVELHRVQGRPGDTLVLQEQDAVAARLGDADADALMARVAEAGRRIAIANDEAWYDIASRVRGRSARDRDRPIGDLCVRGNRLALTDEMRPPQDPFRMLDVAIAAAREGKRMSHSTLNAMVGAPAPPEQWPDDARERFVELLLTGHGATEVIEVLQLRGLWTRLIPEWRPAISRPQRNAFHRYTVDRHLLESAAVASESAHLVQRGDLLVVSALLHDIGKAYPELGDHSQQGAWIAEEITRRMGFSGDDVATVGCLVEHHLLMADVATRRDLEDPATAEFLAAKLGTTERVELLHALTRADAMATGPHAWSAWKSDLVDLLATRTVEVLDGRARWRSEGREFPDPQQRGLLDRWGTHVVGEGDRLTVAYEDRPGAFSGVGGVLALHGLDVLSADVHSNGFRCVAEFAVRVGPSGTVAWDRVTDDVEKVLGGRLALRSRLSERERSLRRSRHAGEHQFTPAVRFDNGATTDSTVVEVVGPDSVGLLYRLARALGEFDLRITRARIDTRGVDVVDSFYVTMRDGDRVTAPELQAELTRALLDELDPVAGPAGG